MPIGNTDLVQTKNALIISLVQRELLSKAVTIPTVFDASVYAVKGTLSVGVPRAGSFTVTDRATTVAATLANVTYAKDTITLGEVPTVSWVVDPQDEVESQIEVQADLAMRAAAGIANFMDLNIVAGLESASTATTTAGAITKAIFLEMRQALLTAEADSNALTFLCGPDSESALLGISEFVAADVYGSAIIPSGQLGKLYGVSVVMKTSIASGRFYMYDKSGYGFAIQKALNLGMRAAPEYGSSAELRTMDMKFGSGALQNSLLLRKDNN